MSLYAPAEGKSVRKPFNNCAGYIASSRTGLNKGWVVIYLTAEQGLEGDKYMTSCEAHLAFVTSPNLPGARAAMKAPHTFCEGCRAGVAL